MFHFNDFVHEPFCNFNSLYKNHFKNEFFSLDSVPFSGQDDPSDTPTKNNNYCININNDYINITNIDNDNTSSAPKIVAVVYRWSLLKVFNATVKVKMGR